MHIRHKAHLLVLPFLLIISLLLFSSNFVSARSINQHHALPAYPTVNNRAKAMNKIRIKPGRSHRETIHSSYGPRVTFKTLAFIPRKIDGKDFFVQSLNVLPNGRYAYIGYDHNPSLKHLRSATKVVRFNLKNHRYKTSHTFRGGHGQALAYNPNQRSLWLLTDSGGPISRGGLAEVDLKSLKPMRRVRFRLSHGEALGDTLAFDNHNHVYNENRIWRKNSSKRFRSGIVVLYQGMLNRRHAAFKLVKQGLRHAPGNVKL